MNRREQAFNPPTGPRNSGPRNPRPARKKLRCEPPQSRPEAQYGQHSGGARSTSSARNSPAAVLERRSPGSDGSDGSASPADSELSARGIKRYHSPEPDGNKLPPRLGNYPVQQEHSIRGRAPLVSPSASLDAPTANPHWTGKADTYRPEQQSPSESHRYLGLPKELRFQFLTIERKLEDIEPTVWTDQSLYWALGEVNSLVGTLADECETTITTLNSKLIRFKEMEEELCFSKGQCNNLHRIVEDLETSNSSKDQHITELLSELEKRDNAIEHHKGTQRDLQGRDLRGASELRLEVARLQATNKSLATNVRKLETQLQKTTVTRRRLSACQSCQRLLDKTDQKLPGSAALQTGRSEYDTTEHEKQLESLGQQQKKLEAESGYLKTANEELKAQYDRAVNDLEAARATSQRWEDKARAAVEEALKFQEVVRVREVEAGFALSKKNAEVEDLKAETTELLRLIRLEQEAVLRAATKNEGLQLLVLEKVEEISRLQAVASPTTPNLTREAQRDSQHSLSNSGATSRASTPNSPSQVYIKQERPDTDIMQTAQPASVPPISAPDLQEPIEHIRHLGQGLSSMLTEILDVSNQHSDIEMVTTFVAYLGASSYNVPAAVTVDKSSFWEFKGAYTEILTTPIKPPDATLLQNFTRLCLLFPFIENGDYPDLHQALAELISSLIKAGHSASPRPGIAFLQAMGNLSKQSTLQISSARSCLLAIMVCELCRVLENSFPGVAKRHWDLRSILGDAVYDSISKLPIGRLSAALQDPFIRASTQAMREMLSSHCGEQFSFFTKPDERGTDHDEMGLLHCADDPCFLLINFSKRWFQLISRRVAYMQNNPLDRKKHDLMIGRDDGTGELFKLEAAPKDVLVFWTKFAMDDS